MPREPRGGSKWGAFQRYGSDVVRFIRIRNVLNAPVLLAITVGLALPVAAVFAYRISPILAYWLLGLGTAPILVTLFGWVYFAVREPDRIQTEDHIERMAETEYRVVAMRGSEVGDPLKNLVEQQLDVLPTEGEASDGDG